MLPEWLPWLLQVNDSQFPSGAYAHSMGLEELVQRGAVKKPEDLEAFLQHQIIPSLLAFELPYLIQAHALAGQGDPAELRALDEELDAWKLAAELRQASRQLGSRRLSLIQKLDADPA
jgi:urease accessory protein